MKSSRFRGFEQRVMALLALALPGLLPAATHSAQSATFSVDLRASAVPTITVQPSAAAIAEGKSATLTVTATGSNLTYQWYRGAKGDTSLPVSGATESSFTTASLTATTTYWVRVTGRAGTADSEAATVTVGGGAVSFEPTNKSVDYRQQSYSLAITAVGEWTVTNIPSWISVSSRAGTGSRTITVEVQENSGSSPRSGSITIGEYAHPIAQSGKKNIAPELDVVGNAAGAGTFYDRGAVSHLFGTPDDTMVFRVLYRDKDGDPPGPEYPRLVIKRLVLGSPGATSVFEPDTTARMTRDDTAPFATGSVYTASLRRPVGTYIYDIQAYDSNSERPAVATLLPRLRREGDETADFVIWNYKATFGKSDADRTGLIQWSGVGQVQVNQSFGACFMISPGFVLTSYRTISGNRQLSEAQFRGEAAKATFRFGFTDKSQRNSSRNSYHGTRAAEWNKVFDRGAEVQHLPRSAGPFSTAGGRDWVLLRLSGWTDLDKHLVTPMSITDQVSRPYSVIGYAYPCYYRWEGKLPDLQFNLPFLRGPAPAYPYRDANDGLTANPGETAWTPMPVAGLEYLRGSEIILPGDSGGPVVNPKTGDVFGILVGAEPYQTSDGKFSIGGVVIPIREIYSDIKDYAKKASRMPIVGEWFAEISYGLETAVASLSAAPPAPSNLYRGSVE